MHLAAIEGFDTTVCTLLEHGANPDVYNEFKFMPIHYLAMKNHAVSQFSSSFVCVDRCLSCGGIFILLLYCFQWNYMSGMHMKNPYK